MFLWITLLKLMKYINCIFILKIMFIKILLFKGLFHVCLLQLKENRVLKVIALLETMLSSQTPESTTLHFVILLEQQFSTFFLLNFLLRLFIYKHTSSYKLNLTYNSDFVSNVLMLVLVLLRVPVSNYLSIWYKICLSKPINN